MKNYQHMLLATDLSEESDKLAAQARLLADKAGAKLSIVHVYSYIPISYGNVECIIPVDMAVKEQLLQQVKQRFDEQAEQLNIDAEQRWLMVGGAVKDELIKRVKEQQMDLMIMGNHSQHGLALLFGTTTDSLLHAMPCDVLALRLAS